MTENERLWCVDTGIPDETQYIGPFESKERAEAMCAEEIARGRKARVLGCMRAPATAPASHLDTLANIITELVIETLEEHFASDPPTPDAWAAWEDQIVEAREGAEEAMEELLRVWTRDYLRTLIYVNEPEKTP